MIEQDIRATLIEALIHRDQVVIRFRGGGGNPCAVAGRVALVVDRHVLVVTSRSERGETMVALHAVTSVERAEGDRAPGPGAK